MDNINTINYRLHTGTKQINEPSINFLKKNIPK